MEKIKINKSKDKLIQYNEGDHTLCWSNLIAMAKF